MPPAATNSASWFTRPVFRWSVAILAAVAAGILVFEALDISVFKRIGMPHEFCYLRDPKLIWLHVIADILIGVAYVSISATLAYLVYKASKDIPFNWVFLAFGLFIVSCGLTHFMEVWVIWEPVYWLSGYVKVVTAAASVATALALFPLVPKIFGLIESARQSERRRIEIEQLNQELERFNYSVAHDLRAPLRGITGLGQVLLEDFAPQLPPPAQEHIRRMQASAGKMDALVTDLLRYATIGRQQLELKPVALRDAIRPAIELLETEISERKAAIVVAPHIPHVIGDATLLQVVFQNLLGNSLKFATPGVPPRVEIAAKREGAYVIVDLVDNGIGIPAESRERIFGMFERLDPNQPGTGIGLALVHRAVERLGGQIVADQGAGGVGTRISICLPAAPRV